jgi:hypothetical protein
VTAARTARKTRRPRTLPASFPMEVATAGGFWLSVIRRATMQLDALQDAMDKAARDEILWFAMLQGRDAIEDRINTSFDALRRAGDLLRVLPASRGAA